MIIAEFDRTTEQVYVYVDEKLIVSYWRVAGLTKKLDRHVVVGKDRTWLGRITGEAHIKETW